MRCKTCDHILWNHEPARDGSPRLCSECGTRYAPSDFDFVRGKVEFCCPHCRTAYFGTSPRGHLEPNAFMCAECAQPITMDECVLRGYGVADERLAMLPTGVPWLSGHSWRRRWWATVGIGMGRPNRLNGMFNSEPRLADAARFLALHGWLSAAPAAAFFLLTMAWPLLNGSGAGIDMAVVAVFYVSMPLSLYLLAWSGAFAASLVGRAHGLSAGRAFELCAYSSGPLVFFCVPCVGGVAYVWWAIAAVVAMSEAVPLGKGVAVVMMGLLGFFFLGIVLIAFIVFSGFWW